MIFTGQNLCTQETLEFLFLPILKQNKNNYSTATISVLVQADTKIKFISKKYFMLTLWVFSCFFMTLIVWNFLWQTRHSKRFSALCVAMWSLRYSSWNRVNGLTNYRKSPLQRWAKHETTLSSITFCLLTRRWKVLSINRTEMSTFANSKILVKPCSHVF